MMKDLVSKLRAWQLKTDFLLFSVSAVIAIVCAPAYELYFAPGIDGSLPWVFNYFADGHYLAGKNTLFPHGPLAFLLYPLAMGNNLIIALFLHLVMATLLGYSWFKISPGNSSYRFLLPGVILLLFLSFADIQLVITAQVASLVLLYRKTENMKFLIFSVLLAVLNLFIKTYGGIICGLLIAGEFVTCLIPPVKKKPALIVIITYTLAFFVGWLCLYGSLSGSFTFIRGQFELSSNNSEAVQFQYETNWLLLGGCLAGLLTIYWLTADKGLRMYFLLMLVPLFAAWKHAMARSEEFHLRGSLNFLLLFFFILWIVMERKKALLIAVSLSSLFFLTIALGIIREVESKTKRFEAKQLRRFYDYTFNYDSLLTLSASYSGFYIRNQYLPDSLLQLIGKKSVDVYPWNYALIPANHLNWQPRPVINSYACYTHWLDKQNSIYIQSGKGAEYFIWEQTDSDTRGLELESIDRRYLLNDEPQAVAEFFSSYRLLLKSGRFLIYEKLKNKSLTTISAIDGQTPYHFGEWIKVPEFSPTEIMRARVTINKTIAGMVKSALYKGELFYITYRLSNDKIYTHRIVPRNAEDGLWINPLIMHPGDDALEPYVKQLRIDCENPPMVNPEFLLQFESIKLNAGGKVMDIPSCCFGKKTAALKGDLYFNLTSAGQRLDTSFFRENKTLKTSNENYMSEPLSYILEPGQRSGMFIIKVDSPAFKTNCQTLRFCFEAYIKKPVNPGLRFLIVKDTSSVSKNIVWSSGVDEMPGTGAEWLHYYYIQDVAAEKVSQYSTLYFYISNEKGNSKVYLDDISVRVSGK